MIGNPWFYVISIPTVIILSFLIPFIRMKFWWVLPLLTLTAMTLVGFILPNFYNDLSWEPLIGYAVFLTVLSITVTILSVMLVRKRKRAKEERRPGHGDEYD